MDPRMQRLVELEARKKGVPPALALQVMQQESAGDPGAVGDGGRSLGLFQLQEGAAVDAGIDPAQRIEPVLNIEGGVEYLRQQLQRANGDPALALEMYNKGPSLQGRGTPGYAQQVLARGETPMQVVDTRAALEERLQALRARKAGTPQGAPSSVPAPAKSPGPLDTPAVEVSPDDAAALAQRSQFTLDIAKPSTSEPAPEVSPAERLASIPGYGFLTYLPSSAQASVVEAVARWAPTILGTPQQDEAAPLSAEDLTQRIDALAAKASEASKTGTGLGIQAAGGIGGAMVGGLASPMLGPAGPILGGIVGGSLATRGATALGLIPPETPLVETPVVNLYPSDVVGAAIPGIAGRVLGTAAARSAGPLTQAVAPVVGEAVGNLAGRQAHVAMGIEAPGLAGDIASVAVPLGLSGAGALARRVPPTLPGASRVMHDIAGERLEELPQRLGPAVPSDQLFAQAAQHNPAIVPVSITKTARDLLAREQALPSSLQNREVQRVAGDMLTLSARPGASIPLQQLDAIRQRVGLLVRQANAENWPQATGLRATYRSIMDDLGTAAQQGVPGAQPLMQALGAHRQERAMEGLTDLWSPGKGLQLDAGDITHVYGKRIQNQFEKRLTDDQLFAGSFTPDELVDIRETLSDVARLTSRSPTDSGNWVGQGIKWLGSLAGLTEAVGGNVPSAVALTIAAEAAPALLATAMQSSIGRAALRLALAEGKGTLTAAGLRSVASVVMRNQMAGDTPPEPQQREGPP